VRGNRSDFDSFAGCYLGALLNLCSPSIARILV
jgi:hypothetical protein